MVGVEDRWLHPSSRAPKEDAPCPAAHHSFASPAKKNNNALPPPIRHPKRGRFAVGSSSAVAKRIAPPTSRWPRNSAAIPARSANGGPASPPTGSPAWPISLAAALRGLFPPEDRHKV